MVRGSVQYWIFVPWMDPAVDIDAFAQNCSILNGKEVFAARQRSGTRWREFPVARLVLTLSEFDVDCFSWESYTFVSARLREALNLASEAVQYFDVDTSQCSPQVQKNDYKIINVCRLENAVDPRLSGLVMGRLTPSSPEMVMDHGNLTFVADFSPAHEAFHDRVVRGYAFFSDPPALRALKAGCTGVRFFDASRFRFGRGPLNEFRTLRGIEQDQWDPVTEKSVAQLIQAFH